MPDRRRIVIALGERTTETHCNDCSGWVGRLCGNFGHTERASDAHGFMRLPECRAAEIPAAPSGCTCTTQLRNGDARVPRRRCPVHGNRTHLTLLPGAKGWARE